jgi:hypothetical protein
VSPLNPPSGRSYPGRVFVLAGALVGFAFAVLVAFYLIHAELLTSSGMPRAWAIGAVFGGLFGNQLRKARDEHDLSSPWLWATSGAIAGGGMAAFFVDLNGWTLWSIPIAIVAGAWLGGFARDVAYTLVLKPGAAAGAPAIARMAEEPKLLDEGRPPAR